MNAARATEVTALSRTLVESWNRADWLAYRALAAPAYRYEEAASGRRIDDIDAVVADWRQAQAVFPDVDAEIADVLAHGDTSVVALVWRATHTGTEPPSHKRIRIGDHVTLIWDGGRLLAERHQLGFLSVLAAVPAVTGGDVCC